MIKNCRHLLRWFLWILQGLIVGFGAILPGVSGGTLCAAFGMYRPLIETLSHPKKGLQKYGMMLGLFLFGAAAGFIGLSGLAGFLLEENTPLLTCIFIGLILGTIPQLWREAGEMGRPRKSYWAMGAGFLLMLLLLVFLKTQHSIRIETNLAGFFFCGILWGLSFIVPGLSSSSLLLFFDLYQPMLTGIAQFQLQVLLPMAAGMLLCIVLLSKIIQMVFEKHHTVVSHIVIGIVMATTVMLLPKEAIIPSLSGLLYSISMLAGGIASYWFTRICDKLKQSSV